MPQVNIYTPFKDQQKLNTIAERKRMLDGGMTELTPSEVTEHLAILGFKIDKSCTFDYYNTGNAISHFARSVSIIDIKTKMSFAHCDFGMIDDQRERRSELQKLRISHFGWDGNRIWDL